MDNPEEVLQALDEFQKMRPSEIPRELEDYLSFVAKTGDPVYQWSLIKPLFREKLVRVMTDFYESCPTLDLASSPNIEQFNYDIMKCNLLALLESFANAPFTVQRICELLTSPRKEYNRVDKFMRAIEKNILVVSTKEPGLAARRSENGDSMVNGTIDDDESTPIAQTLHEVEMESWVKDCTADATVSTIPIIAEHDVPLLVTAAASAAAVAATQPLLPIPATKITPKDLLSDDENASSLIQDKNAQLSSTKSSEMTVSNFIAAAHELSNTTNITSTALSTTTNTPINNETSSSMICSNNIQNTSTNIGGDSNDPPSPIGINVSDVTDAIINEDTSSQPSLDSESGDDSETHVATGINNKQLQTTFQTKDFVKIDVGDDIEKTSNSKYDSDNNDIKIEQCKLPSGLSLSSVSLINNETDINIGERRLSPIQQTDEIVSNSDDESKSSCDSNSESNEKRPRIECDNEPPPSQTNTTAATTTDRIDNSESNFTSITSTVQSDSSNNELDSDEIDNSKLSIHKTKTIVDELTGKSSELSSNNVIIQTDSLFSTTPQRHIQEFSSDSTIDSDSSKDSESVTESSEDSTSASESSTKPIVEEPTFDNIDECSQRNKKISEPNINTTIVEAMDDDIKETNINTMVPDPIPIIEEPKDDGANVETHRAAISELSVDNLPVNQFDESAMLQHEQEQLIDTSINIVQTMNVSKDNDGISVAVPATPPSIPTILSSSNSTQQHDEILTAGLVEEMESKTIDAGESMEIDSEETMAVFHRIDDDDDDEDIGDEPMEQESGELIKS